jgi:hypothetical protein
MNRQSTDPTMVPTPKGVYEELRKGRKKCPMGDHYIAARAIRCPICGDLPIKPMALEKAIKIVREMGGLKKVKAQIEAVEVALDALKRLGGLEGAKKVVENLEKLEALMK